MYSRETLCSLRDPAAGFEGGDPSIRTLLLGSPMPWEYLPKAGVGGGLTLSALLLDCGG